MNPSSKLFDKAGYITLREYIDDIELMRKHGPWKIPLGLGDSMHFFLLKCVAKFSWFSSLLHVEHAHSISPAYAMLLSYLKKNKIFDTLYERNLHYPGYYSFYLEKGIKVGNRTYTMSGQGVSEDIATAFSTALGEMIERAVSGMYDRNRDILEASPAELMKVKNAVYPPKYHRVFDVQKERYKELNHHPDRKISWVKGINLVTKEIAYIPRQITSWFSRVHTKKEVFVHPTTNGAAGYFTKEGAVLRGILELVQRDGFLVHWLTTIPPRLIIKETLPEHLQKKMEQLQAFGISLYVLDITSLSIPSVFVAAVSSQADIPQVVLSGASAMTFEEAIQSALKEIAIGSEMFYYGKEYPELEGIDKKPEPFVSNVDKIARQLYWRGEDRMKEFQWFISGERVAYDSLGGQNLAPGDESHQLAECLRVLCEKGEAYFPVVYYPKNSIQEKVGFYIAQVFIPKAFPLYLFEGYGTFDSDRLKEFATSKNIKDWKLNPLPHMFS
jgi:thiazole/oxazole-forming peptide maturase SagD family component